MKTARSLLLLAAAVCPLFAGCLARPLPMQAQAAGPLYVPSDSPIVWERIVEVLHELHFTIAREDRVEGVVETDYRTGSGILEPWHNDSVNAAERWESTLQSIRRRVVVTSQPATDGGNVISVRVDKEIEDMAGLASNSVGAATFHENQTLDRNLDDVVGQSQPSMWIPRGRDMALEQLITSRIRRALNR